MATNYKVLIGCNYPPDDARAEQGDILQLPKPVADSLVELGAVEVAP